MPIGTCVPRRSRSKRAWGLACQRWSGGLGGVVEADPGLDLLDQHEPLRLAAGRVREFRDGVGRPERLVVLGERDFQRIRERSAFTGSDEIGRLPAENVGRKPGELPDRGSRVGFALQGDVLDAIEEAGMVGDDVLVRDTPAGGGQRGRRDDQARPAGGSRAILDARAVPGRWP